ncbi:MAG: YbhB/YbcL family Raf kinase inhibitor-like protein [Alphaproteobacteria bacterium]|nr:YbhB/YbcL family Raf kinase inhibitor-like protein [Alphaproteobacteria bacterium]MDE2335784.1 YbhB/YbcL family Raf kinase inhibitor-like protein [Alphaproteobacteria bacterium]
MQLKSAAFSHSGKIPSKHTCEGGNVSPALHWEGAPQGTRRFALIMEDPDAPAGIWCHWIVYDIPADARGLPEQVPPEKYLPDGAVQGRNSFRKTGYGGPCPPPRHGPHRYFFRLYALDSSLDLPPNAVRDKLLSAMEGHILGRAELMGICERGGDR